MSESRTPSLFKAFQIFEETGGYTGHIALHGDPKARQKMYATPTSVATSMQPMTVVTATASAAAESTSKLVSTTPSSILLNDSTRKRVHLDMLRKPLRGNSTGVLIAGGDSSTSKRSESVIVNNHFPLSSTSTSTTKRKCSTPNIASRLTPISREIVAIPKNSDANRNRLMPTVLFSPSPLILSSSLPIDSKKSTVVLPMTGDKFVVCEKCGSTSKNFKTCDSCSHLLEKHEPTTSTQANAKFVEKKFHKAASSLPSHSFYSRKLCDANYPMRMTAATTATTTATPFRRKTPLVLQRFSRKTRKVKAAAKNEPVVLILSSDDEGEELSADYEENGDENNLPSSASSHLDDESVVSCVAGTSMEELTNKQLSTAPSPHLLSPSLGPQTLLNGTINLHCRLRIGSYRVSPKDPITVYPDRFSLKIPTTINRNEVVMINISVPDIATVWTYFGHDIPALFFYLTASCAANIRSRLWMRDRAGPFYDPSCADSVIKTLIMLPEALDDTHRTFLDKLFNDLTVVRKQEDPFHKRIDKALVNKLLIDSTPKKAMEDLDWLCNESTPKKITRTPVIRQSPRIQKQQRECITLVTYPPAPEMGGIEVTSEDIRCLVPGEFLNDVIIDFYLKYLFGEKLSDEDRKRTHIFSSFFYKRLTNSEMPSDNEFGKDVSRTNGNRALSMAESRHSRVKNWTRNVNIFTKDFIIIPINENSHWFLAVICFAHLVGVVGDEEQCPPPSSDHDYESDRLEECLFGNDLHDTPIRESQDQSKSTKNYSSFENKPTDVDACISKRPCILIFDSLRSHSCWSQVFRHMREYLAIEYQHKMNSKLEFSSKTIHASSPNVPQQANYSDCGIFVLQYVESFFKNPIQNFQPPIRGIDRWFSSEEIHQNKRKQIEEVILTLRRDQEEQNRAATTPASILPVTPVSSVSASALCKS